MSTIHPAAAFPNLSARLNDRPALKQNLPIAQSLRASYVSLFNFPPSDFSFYQQPPSDTPDPLSTNLLHGAFHLDSHSSLSVSAVNFSGSTAALPALTIELWVNLSVNTSSSSYLFSYADTSGYYLRLYNPSNLQVTSNALGTSLSSGVNLADGQWHHVALVLNSSRQLLLYVDTRAVTLSGTPTLSVMLKDGGAFVAANSSASGSSGCGGYVGQIRLWKSARTLPQIITAAGSPVLPEEAADLRLCWADRVDTAQKKVNDSSSGNNDGTVTLSSQPPNPWWDPQMAYGALEDKAHLSPHPANMTGNLLLDRSCLQAVYCSSGHLALDSTAKALTIEFWIKPGSSNKSSAMLLGLEIPTSSGASKVLALKNPKSLTVSWDSHDLSSNVNLCDGYWHHVAFSWDWSDAARVSWKLYVDTLLKGSKTNSDVPAIDTHPFLYLGGDGNNDDDNYFTGCLAEFRVWQSVRDASEILSDASYRLTNPPPTLRLYWPFARDFRGDAVVEDFSSYNSRGRPLNSPGWEDDLVFGVYASHLVVPPTPAPSTGAGEPMSSWDPSDASLAAPDGLVDGAAAGFPRVSQEDVLQAFTQAQASGFFDKRFFPNIRDLHSDQDHAAARHAIAGIAPQVFLSYWIMGRRLDLVRRKHNRFAYRFIPAPIDTPTARLLLVETYRMSAYLGAVGEGQVVRTFSLMPGESTFFSVSSFKETSTTAESASSVFDSYNQASQDSFERAIGTDQSSETSEGAELDFYANAEVKQRWGTGNADVSTGGSASGNISHSNFFQQTTNALLSHAAEASSARNVEVNTSYSVQTQSGRQTSVTREIRNINSGRTLDLIFRQLAQEYLTVLHLVDVRVGYYDPNPGSFRIVALSELDGLLDEVLIDNADTKLACKQAIINQAYALASLCRATPGASFLLCQDKSTGAAVANPDLTQITADQAFSVNPQCLTNYQYPEHAGVVLQVPGLVMAHTPVVMRTDNVVAEATVGDSVGLDVYALGLQTAGLQRQHVENEIRQAEAAKLAQANEIVANGDQTRAALYAQMHPAPRVNNNVMYADETGVKPPAQS